jgi:hypothetical protein
MNAISEFTELFSLCLKLGLNNYLDTKAGLLLFKIHLRKYLAVILLPVGRPYCICLLFSWIGKHNVDCDPLILSFFPWSLQKLHKINKRKFKSLVPVEDMKK